MSDGHGQGMEEAAPQQYMHQEGVYVNRLISTMEEDVRSDIHPVGQLNELYVSDDEQAEVEDPELVLSFSHQSCDDATVKERTEWQAMLSNVLTGEVFQAEKSRLQGQNRNTKPIMRLWTELKATVACRTLNEQNRILNAGRGVTHEVLDRIANFKPLPTHMGLRESFADISELLTLLERCEALWPTRKAMRDYFPVYGSEEFTVNAEALTAFLTVNEQIFAETDLLRRWTGNDQADPTLPGHIIAGQSLVQSSMMQEGSLKAIFEKHIEKYLFPLVSRAKQVRQQYEVQFSSMNLPDCDENLEPLIKFSTKLVQQSMELRLHAAAKMYSPNSVMIDEAVMKFEMYLELGLKLAQNCLALGQPLYGSSLNNTMLKSIRFYLDLLSNKFLDGGSSSMSFFRSFKNIEQLEGHFRFLQVTCRLIEGGDVSVAEQFCSLHLRVLSRLLAYWEHQMDGPRISENIDVGLWYIDTCENIRGIHRKLMRFYKTLCNTYENSCDFNLGSSTKMSEFLAALASLGYALIIPDTEFESTGTYAFASRVLRNQPVVVKSLLQGYCRPPSEPHEPGAIVFVNISEPLSWTGPVLRLPLGSSYILPVQAKVRLCSQGGFQELSHVQRQQPQVFEELLVKTVNRRSQLPKVETEIQRMRGVWLKLMMAVLMSAMRFRRKMLMNGKEHMETVQVMMAFAHDFGERSLRLVPEVNRDKIVLKMFEFCLEWLEFVIIDCPADDSKKFKWTVTALEFAMKMTKGLNVLALPDSQFTKLREKVAECMAILIAHYDIMGVRSKAANLTSHNHRLRILQQFRQSQDTSIQSSGNLTPVSGTAASYSSVNNNGGTFAVLKDDDEVIAAHRMSVKEQFDQLENRLSSQKFRGKILDHHNTEFEFLSFASSPFTSAAMRWQRGEMIGEGAFGVVFRANSLDDFQVMAVKEMKITMKESSKVLKDIKAEMNVLEMVSHPNIVQYYGVEVHRDRVYIFMEYCTGGSLQQMLDYGKIDDEAIVQFFSLQILEGLAYLHDLGIVHRDIKPANILLHNNFIKIVDFGAAKIIAKNKNLAAQTSADRTKGTPMYMAPEVIANEPSATLPSVDMWSFGCVIGQMVVGVLPWSDHRTIAPLMYFLAHFEGSIAPDDCHISPECREILDMCVQRDPSKRPSAMDLLRDPWFDQARQTLNQFLEMRDEDLYIGDEGDDEASVNSHNTSLGTHEGMHTDTSQPFESPTVSDVEQREPNQEMLHPPELVSGYEQHSNSSEVLAQVTPMEPIAESDMEYQEKV